MCEPTLAPPRPAKARRVAHLPQQADCRFIAQAVPRSVFEHGGDGEWSCQYG
jgi:hypothetical protein